MFLQYLYGNLKVTGPFFIVVPLSTLGNWERELRNWTDMNVVVYRGRESARNLIVDGEFFYRNEDDSIIPNLYKFDILLTTYDMCNEPSLKCIPWRCAVLDEVFSLKLTIRPTSSRTSLQRFRKCLLRSRLTTRSF
jgi:SNF2 family DNA or RNA helicase